MNIKSALDNVRKRTFSRGLITITALVVAVGVIAPVSAASPNLVNRATEAGVSLGSTPSWDVCVSDFNGDGNTDFHASLHMKNPGALFRNNNDGTFTRTAVSMPDPLNNISPRPTPGFASNSFVDRHACAWADVDGNGLQDMYSAAGRWASNKYKDASIDNELWLQTSPGVFKDFATVSGVGEPCTRGRHVVFADYSLDGRPDLFLGAQLERSDSGDRCNTETGPNGYPYNEQSKVFVNRGDDANGNWLGFRTAPEFNVSVASVGNRIALNWDENRDGRPDLLAQTFFNKVPLLYRHTGSGFQEVSKLATVKLPVMNGAKVGDITGDGIDDLVFADSSGFAYRRGTATGISLTTVRLGSNVASNADGWSVALGDANGDGKVDVYGLTNAATAGAANPDDILYVANATGTAFTPHVVPSATGDANDVETVTVNGLAQFVVVNGGNGEKETPGPVQLIAWRP